MNVMRLFDHLTHARALIAAAIGAVVLLACAHSMAQPATLGAEMQRPADLDTWPNIGATIRMSRPGVSSPSVSGSNETGMGAAADAAHAGASAVSTPAQLRQVLMAPGAYESFVRSGAYPDGAAFAAVIYLLQRDGSFTPEIYGPQGQHTLVLEVIDRSHPDGRRFYSFANGSATATVLPPGNECAVCHNQRGSFDGTFAQFYPAITSRRASVRRGG